MPDGQWRMFAHRYDDGLLYNLGEKWWVEIHGLSEPVVTVDVREVEDDSPEGTHWAWIKTGESEPLFSHPYRGGLEICFTYGSKVEVERGKGRIVRLAVTEVAGA